MQHPRLASFQPRHLKIDEDYYTGVAPDPTDDVPTIDHEACPFLSSAELGIMMHKSPREGAEAPGNAARLQGQAAVESAEVVAAEMAEDVRR